MTDIRFLYITAKDFQEARKLAQKALEERVAACANILPQMESLYWWQGQLESASECVLVLKTRAELVEAATDLIRHWHSYSTPCIVSLPVESGNDAYLSWLRGETKTITTT